MGFSRYEFKLPPQGTLDFVVSEEATFTCDLTSTSDLVNLIKLRSAALILGGIIEDKSLEVFKGIVRRTEAISALGALENGRFSERDLSDWRAGSQVGGTYLDENLLKVAAQIISLRAVTAEMQRQIDAHKRHIEKVFQNQSRLRENIKSLDKMVGSDLMKRYLKDLDLEEDDLIKTRKEIEDTEARKSQLDKELNDLQFSLASNVRNRRTEL